ncbi:MAG: lactate racemase domain-containing protein [Desulfobacterales bacterium]
MEYPHMIRVRQRFDDTILENVAEEIDARLADLNLETAIKPGQSVAIACSSRGIDNYGVIVKAVITYLKQFKLEPFIIPAMGSHGAATAAGQKRVLAHLGVVEEDVGAPIRSSLEVMRIGKTEDHLTVYLDKLASAADHIVLINRIKKHTEFEHEFESGLLKMMAIGLGKQEGAAAYHEAMLSLGYPRVILTVARKIMQSTNVLFGVGVVENGYGQTAQIGIGRSDDILEMEKGLFKKARQFAPALPFDEADILIIDEMGKDISGTGFDTKVVGRIGLPLVAAEPTSPRIKRIMVCDLTEGSEGNAVGVGIVDIITQRLLDKIDMDALNINTITGVCPEMGKIPLTLKNDRDAVEIAIKCVGLIPNNKLKIMRIKNTGLLSDVDVSEGYQEELAKRSDLEVVMEKRKMGFNTDGNLLPFSA